jgi:hypothetical protein
MKSCHQIFATIFALLLLPYHVTLGSLVNRGQRADDSLPLEALVTSLSQKVDQLTAQNQAQDTQIAQLTSRLGKHFWSLIIYTATAPTTKTKAGIQIQT